MFDRFYAVLPESITEGGGVRNFQIAKFLRENSNCKINNIRCSNKFRRIIKGFQFIKEIFLAKNERILINYPVFWYFFGSWIVTKKYFLIFLVYILSYSSKNNQIFIEVNDLAYEQAIDLELPINKLNKLDEKIFKLSKISFIFASSEMMNYAKNKFKMNSKCDFIINGGIPKRNNCSVVNKKINRDRLNFVYAGTLNRGRQIEEIINIFSKIKHNLILIGADGSWIKEYADKFENIKYFGEFNEEDAHSIVEDCDCGIIPYNEKRLYYNICFPTKASFYITAGITFISTPLDELKNHFSEDEVFFVEIENWIDKLSCENLEKEIILKNKKIDFICKKFYWSEILMKLKIN